MASIKPTFDTSNGTSMSSMFGYMDVPVIDISLSGLAIGSLVGIILNAALPGKDYVFEDNQQAAQSKEGIIQAEPIKSQNKKKKKK